VVSGVFGQVRIPLVLRLFEVREHVLEPPTGVTHAFPVIVVPLVAPHVQHSIEHAGAANHLAPGPTAPMTLHRLARRLIRLSLVLPVVLTAVQVQRYGGHVRNLGLVSTSLQQQHVPFRVRGQSVGDHGTGRTAANYYEIILGSQVLLVHQTVLRVVQVIIVIGQSGQERGQKQ